MVDAEYSRFLQTLITAGAPGDVCKIANLVRQHMDIIKPLTTAKGLRIKKIVELAQTNWNTIGSSIQSEGEQTEAQVCPFTQIKSLSVGPFRGFAQKEVFDLASRIVLIYGPNGTGKSSFCEALEYCLLKNVTEAENRRFRNQNDFLKNAHTNSFVPPVLIGTDAQAKEMAVSANEELYRFCFIEKNRIESFSRIAAQPPAKQTELISTLFGLEDFSEFVHNFTDSMDSRYIDLEGIKQKELNIKSQALASYQMDLLRIPGELQDLDKEEETLGRTYREGCSFIQMVMELNGTEGKDGLIKTFETELRTPIAVKSNQTLAGLNGMRISINTNVRVLKEKEGEIEAVSNQVSFKQLYEAISSLRKHSTDVCPACHTPLSKTVVDPFSHAESELMKLRHIGELQSDIAKQKERIAKQHAAVVRIINMCCDKFPDNNILKSYGIEDGVANAWEWWESLHHSIGDGLTPWMYLEKQVKELEELDEAISQAARIRSEKQNELDRLRDFNTAIISLKARREEAEKKLAKAKEEIKLFDTQNAQLILDVNAEQDTVTQNRIIAQAYASYVQRLSAYNSGLPAKLVADLGDTVVDLYNAFNRGDAENERLGTVRLPLQPSQRIEIAFMNAPNKFFDALYILSEGHIRCLGLAILAAKNIRENGPLLIFDDPVNAIDDEHRGAIRDTLFDGKLFEDKQIILACHGEEFFKDIQDQLSLRKAKLIKAYVFLPKEDDYNLRIDRHCTPRNYLIAARDCYSRGEIRSALSKSRQALESLAKNKVWKKYLPRYGDERLSLQLRSEKAPIELRNLVDKLAYKISEKDFPDPNKNAVLAPLESLLGVNGESREWRYLNKGTHEETDREEFDRQTVDVIITALEQLDAAVDRKK